MKSESSQRSTRANKGRQQKVAQFRASVITPSDWSFVSQAFGLSGQELAILKLIFEDECDDGIAHALAISKHTVNTHLKRLYRKLDVHSRVQLVVVTACQLLSLRQGTLE